MLCGKPGRAQSAAKRPGGSSIAVMTVSAGTTTNPACGQFQNGGIKFFMAIADGIGHRTPLSLVTRFISGNGVRDLMQHHLLYLISVTVLNVIGADGYGL